MFMLPPFFALATLSACGAPLAATRSCGWELALARRNTQCTMLPCDFEYTWERLAECRVRVVEEYDAVIETTRMLAQTERTERYRGLMHAYKEAAEKSAWELLGIAYNELRPETRAFLCLAVLLSIARTVWDERRQRKRRVESEKALRVHGECCICLKFIAKGQRIADFSCCRQVFHTHCIKEWFKHNNTCPICRGTDRYELE